MAQFATFQVGLGGGEAAAAELNAFLRSHRVLKVERVAFPEGWTFCVEWLEGEEGASGRNSTEWRRSRKVDYMKVLPPEAFARFSKLRDRRREIATQEGLAPFLIMTDEQLAQVAQAESPALASLREIDGVGEARVKKYGERLLAALHPPGEDDASGIGGEGNEANR